MNSESRSSQKKRREARAFRTFRLLDSTLPKGRPRLGVAGEEPDFVVETSKGNLGVELVEYLTPATTTRWRVKERQVIWEKILRISTDRCNERGIGNVFASVEFEEHVDVRVDEVSSIADILVEQCTPVSRLRLPTRRVPRMKGARCVADFWAHYREGLSDTYVGLAWGGSPPPVESSELLRLVNQKERKLRIYRQNCTAVWLLIVVDQYEPASMAHVPPEFRLPFSSFERVSVLQGWSDVKDIWRQAA